MVVSEFPAVSKDVTYYAVFAHQEITGGAPQTYIYDASHSEGWTNTAFKNNSYWIIRTDQYIESPSIDLSGLASITMNMRSYGGTSYNTVNIIANSKTIATLVAAGNSLADQTWTNTGALSGMSTLRFESANSTSSNGPAFSSITIDATGAGVSYNRYITSCQSAAEVELTPDNSVARKVLIGGKIYIIIDDQVFNLMGQKVK
jgi:hypothetical protein